MKEKHLLGSVLDYWGPYIYLIPANTCDVVNEVAPAIWEEWENIQPDQFNHDLDSLKPHLKTAVEENRGHIKIITSNISYIVNIKHAIK